MKLGNKFLILLIIFALTAGTYVGTALSDSCSKVHNHSASECGSNNCCGCGHKGSTCIDCTPEQSCSTGPTSGYCGSTFYLDCWGGANCSDC